VTIPDPRSGAFTYDVALSFAGEQRRYVEKVAAALRRRGRQPFYDDYEKAELWGKDLYEHLDRVYQKDARYCVLFASEAYARKVWTTHERRSAQARALQSASEYVLPVRFDDTEIPGLRPTVAYIDGLTTSPAALAKLIVEKLGPRVREKFFPPDPDKLFEALDATTAEERAVVERIARSFMQTLTRMTDDERKLIAHVFAEGCRSQMPGNVHLSLDVLRRDLGIAPAEVMDRIDALVSIGFDATVRVDADHEDDVVVVSWSDMLVHEEGLMEDFAFERSTEVAVRMLDVGAGDDGCRKCAEQCVENLDFSLLSTTTTGAVT